MLFDNIHQFESNTALITDDGASITYKELLAKIKEFQRQIGVDKKLIFIEVTNNSHSIIAYLACVMANHPILLLNPDSKAQNKHVIDLYQPNLVIACDDQIRVKQLHSQPIPLHAELAILLSTSGSTGSPKLVKISTKGIFENTHAICQYLNLTQNDRAITSLRFNYSYGLSIINAHLHVGASIFLTNSSITDNVFWQYFAQHEITSFSGVPYSFELIKRQNINLFEFKHLRYLTQAGGKLAPELVKYFAQHGKRKNIDFFVMYGQTEASPRISYLPPKFAIDHPDCIGISLLNGELQIIDEYGKPILLPDQQGELRYRGPNVMMGYANNREDLADKEPIEWLYTGDIAIRNEENLFKIVGRISRFVKPFGIRINLDDIQRALSKQGITAAVASCNEEIIIAIESLTSNLSSAEILTILNNEYKIPQASFKIYLLDKIPTLSNDKFDYLSVSKLLPSEKNIQEKRGIKALFKIFAEEFLSTLGYKKPLWTDLISLFSFYFPDRNIDFNSSFVGLSGDSLQYVSVSLELENYLDILPQDWHNLTIQTLEGMKR